MSKMTEKKGPGDMKKLFFFFLFAAILFLPAGCGRTGDAQTEHIKIAVIGEEAGLYPGYHGSLTLLFKLHKPDILK